LAGEQAKLKLQTNPSLYPLQSPASSGVLYFKRAQGQDTAENLKEKHTVFLSEASCSESQTAIGKLRLPVAAHLKENH
jgi:hypothetical protein